MVTFRVFFALCLLVGAGGSALSQPIDHPNVIGVYFDEVAVSNYMEMGPPVEGATAYLLLLNPEFEAMDEFFARFYVEGLDGPCELSVINSGAFVGSWSPFGGGDVEIDFLTPEPVAEVVTIATVSSIDSFGSVCFLLGNDSYVVVDGVTQPLVPSTRVNDMLGLAASAMINQGDTGCTLDDIEIVSTEALTFSGIRELFHE